MNAHDYYTQENHGPYQLHDLGPFELEEGGTLTECQLAYATFGELNEARDNAILVPTWYSGTSKIMEEVYIGPERALDPTRYFILVVNQIGNGLSTSPHNTPFPEGGPAFPRVRIGDDVRAQYRLATERFGLEKLALVVGGSMGAQQTYEWCVRYPDFVARAAPIAGTARNSEHDFLFTRTLMEAITSDPAFAGGHYRESTEVHAGLRRHARLWCVMGLSTEFYQKEVWRAAGFSSVEDFLRRFLEPYFLGMDPNNLLCMAWKWQRGDVSRHSQGDLAAALGRIRARTRVIAIDEDMFFPPRDCRAEQELIPGSDYREIATPTGHLGLFGTDPAYIGQVDAHLRELLDEPV